MIPKRIVRSCLVIGFLCTASGTPLRADIILDSFDQPSPSVAFQVSSTNNPFSRTDNISVAFPDQPPFLVPPLVGSATRNVTVNLVSPPLPTTQVLGTVGGGSLSVFANELATVTTRLTYTNFNTNYGVPDFSGTFLRLGDNSGIKGISLHFNSVDAGFLPGGGLPGTVAESLPISIVARSNLFGEQMIFSGSVRDPHRFNSPVTFSVKFSDFAGYQNLQASGATDFFDEVFVDINEDPFHGGNRGARFELDSVTAVPTPASLVLLLSMLPVVGGYFVQRRNA